MNKTSTFGLCCLIAILATLIACGDNNPVIPNEEELITTVHYKLTPEGGGADIVLSWIDENGDGNGIVFEGVLQANTNYTGLISLLNESKSPAENIILEILDEAEDHQFFYEVENGLNLTIKYADADLDNNPIGIKTQITTGNTSTGNIDLILRHQPDKFGNGVFEGDKTNAGGVSDISISLSVKIQ